MKKYVITLTVVLLGMTASPVSAQGYFKRLSHAISSIAVAVIDSTPHQTPFPQTGSIPVYKYRLGQKEKIGELQWTATVKHVNSSSKENFTVVNIHVKNTTDTWVKGAFNFIEDDGVEMFEVSPVGRWDSKDLLKSENCLGVKPDQKEIVL